MNCKEQLLNVIAPDSNPYYRTVPFFSFSLNGPFGWMDESGRIENKEGIEKFLVFHHDVWFESKKWRNKKYSLYKFIFMPLIDKKK